MHLNNKDLDKLILHYVGELAKQRQQVESTDEMMGFKLWSAHIRACRCRQARRSAVGLNIFGTARSLSYSNVDIATGEVVVCTASQTRTEQDFCSTFTAFPQTP